MSDGDQVQREAPDEEKIAEVIELLERIVDDRSLLLGLERDRRNHFLALCGQVSRPTRAQRKRLARENRKQKKAAVREDDQALLNRTGIRRLRENPIFRTPRKIGPHVARLPESDSLQPPIGKLSKPKVCYVCRAEFRDVHFFYDQMCHACGDFNWAKRTPTGDLSGRVALVTGSRVKIGYQAAIMLLRAGARVICTTRFPKDAAVRYGAEPDFEEWGSRLRIHGIDLRHTPSVEALCRTLKEEESKLDFIINNACQTVRRPPGYYDHLVASELRKLESVPEHARPTLALLGQDVATSAAAMSQLQLVAGDDQRGEHLFPTGKLDADLQQVDLRKVNSWRLRLDEVSAVELLEVQLVNAVAPFILNARLKPLLVAAGSGDAHVVNVAAMEGQFYRTFKSDKHPHTNMAKAGLNMLTRTSAMDYIHDGIHMNSVDTGWVTDEDPVHHAERKRSQHNFHPPLDIVDGAARIVDPIFDGLATGKHYWGQFLKDYRPTDW